MLARFDDTLASAISEATILWAQDRGQSEPERAAQLKATHLRLSGQVDDLMRHPRWPDRGWTVRVYAALRTLRRESTGGDFESVRRQADAARSARIREAGTSLRDVVKERVR